MRKYHRAIFFTKTPLTKVFKYNELFQIMPAKLDKLPYSKMQNHHPNIIEFWTTPDEKIEVETEFEEMKEQYSDTGIFITKQDKFLALLTLITNHVFFRYYELGGSWGIPILKEDPGDESKLWSTKWCMSWFFYPELPAQLQIKEFTISELPIIEFIPHISYYTQFPNLDREVEKEITFPLTAERFLDSYYKLDSDLKKIIDSAITHIVNSMELRVPRKTLSLLSAFTAVETMVNLEFKDIKPEKCEICGQLKYSIARKFREFLLKYIGDSVENKRKFNSIYSLRSKIVHTGELLKSEQLFSDLPHIDRHEELVTQIEVLQMAKLAIINWVILKGELI